MENRIMNLNIHYLVIFKKQRDQQQMAVLARQQYPSKPNYLRDRPRFHRTITGYLLMNLKQPTPALQRLRTNGMHLSSMLPCKGST